MKWMNKSIHELHDMLVKGEVSATQLVEECIELAETDKCNSFEAMCFEDARKEASKITKVEEDEFLKGIPYFAKDN
jgi:aspartyl-tRNA(Asn)/glutamyl-tRNA(Gln) amidotransferase subunit A